MRHCSSCQAKIPEGRLKLLPNTRTCVNCSSVEAVSCYTVITGKTEYSQIEIVDQETAKRMKRLGNRVGFGVSSGVKFQFDSRKN